VNEPTKLNRTCLKCGHVRRSTDAGPSESCPKCGAIYAKVDAHHGPRAAARGSASDQDGSYDYVDPERRRLAHLVYVLYLLPTGLSTLLGYSIARTSAEEHTDEIAFAHSDWQVETVSRVFYVIIAALVLLLIVGAARAGYWMIHDEVLLHFSASVGKLLLAVSAATYLWVAVRSVKGWMHLFRGEGP
jgi:uncharacterized membrane protein/ribosomal protein S27AE